jgi:hypothetical protein
MLHSPPNDESSGVDTGERTSLLTLRRGKSWFDCAKPFVIDTHILQAERGKGKGEGKDECGMMNAE